MLVSPWNSCVGYGRAEGWACPSLGTSRGHPASCPRWGSLGPRSFQVPGAFSPWVLFMCFGDHFCIVRRKKYSDMVEKRYLHTLVGRKGEGQSECVWGLPKPPPTHSCLCGVMWGGSTLGGRRLSAETWLLCDLGQAHTLGLPGWHRSGGLGAEKLGSYGP